MRNWVRRILIAVATALLAGCSSATDRSARPGLSGFEQPPTGEIGAQVASYETVTGRPQRISVGLVAGDGKLVGYGDVSMTFRRMADGSEKRGSDTATVRGEYIVVAGHRPSTNTTGPRFISGSEGIGVYRADVTFPAAGTWRVRVEADLSGTARVAEADFDVHDEAAFPNIGDPAPRTRNRLLGDTSISPAAIDSRAIDDAAAPDPELHSRTIDDSILNNRPVMVVVSTPTYCQSRFCGPITDAVATRARRLSARMDFVHIEVWNDYANNAMNREAAEWILRDDRPAQEPWVFVVDRKGVIADRFDNIVTEADLDRSINAVLN